MTVLDLLRTFDAPLKVLYYINDEDEPLWEGSLWDTPWWVADLELNYENAEDCRPVIYRHSLGKEYDNKAGLVILVKDK